MKKLRIGVLGGGRGMDIAKNFMLLGCEIVAICDNLPERLENAMKKVDSSVTAYNNFDDFIQHEMDAVILANFFHEHAPYAIKCFEKGIHVFSECISNGTMAEGVELIRAFEKTSGVVYFLAENYPQMIFNREMKRICDTGALGKILYAEGEYNHPSDPSDISFKKEYNYFREHWRNYLPRTYYITHSLGPIMRATGATPRRVTAFAAYAPIEGDYPISSYVGDRAAIITTMNDDGSIFRVTGCAAFGGHHNAYRICGTEGQIENFRGTDKIMLRYNAWSKPDDQPEVNCYVPSWNDKDEDLIRQSGHGGGDYLTARAFVECIEKGEQPEHPYDIYSAISMSSVAILAHRSMLEGGTPYDIPDFKTEQARKQYENDRRSPFYGTSEENLLPVSSNSDFKPTDKQLELYDKMVEEFKK